MAEKNPYVRKTGQDYEITPAGYDFLNNIVTDSQGDVYAFYDKASPLMVAASMARLSRRGSDLRVTFLDEFAATGDDDASGLIHRVVTAFGDDSVQQLVGLHLVVENASNLLTKKLEWGRFGSYLEQSTRYIYFDEKDAQGKYKYFVPTNLPPKLKKEYIRAHDQIFDIYSKMVHLLTDYVRKQNPEPTEKPDKIAWRGATKAQACDAVRPVLPVSTRSTVGIFASAQAIESLVMHLLADELPEARETGQRILSAARKVMPAFFERADKPDRGGATTAYLAARGEAMKLSQNEIDIRSSRRLKDDVELIDYWPKNELDIIPHLLFETSHLSTADLQEAVDCTDVNGKSRILKAYFGQRLNRRHRPGRALEIPHYLWEIVGDYGTFRDLQRHRVVDAFEWQKLTTDYGYEIPQLVAEAGLEDDYNQCFRLSEELVRTLIAASYAEESQYATLFGHRMRYRFMLNARAAFHFIELRTSPQGHPGYRKIVNQMHEKLSEVHPLIGEAMIFANKDEDPELTRMAAELATQYKLEKLSAAK